MKRGTLMKRKTLMWILLGASTLGFAVAILQRNYSRFWPSASNEDAAAAAIAKELKEFNTGASRPSPETMVKIKDMAASAAPGTDLLVAAWLERLYHHNLKESPEFHDLIQLLIETDPNAPQRAVASLRTASQPAVKDYQVTLLVALGKPALSAVMDALKEDALKAGNDYHLAAKSCFPEVAASLGHDALTELRSTVKHPEPAVRRQALRALALMARKGPERTLDAIPDVEVALKDKEKSVRAFAVLAWGELKQANTPAAPVLPLLDDPDPIVRLATARTLARHPGVDLQAVARVIGALLKGDPFRDTWWDVVGIPSTYGASQTDRKNPARQSWDVVGRPETLGTYAVWKGADKGDYTKLFWEETAAHVSLGLGPNCRLPPETIVELLRSCPHDGRQLSTMLAASGHGNFVVPELAKMVKDPDPKQRRKALIALGKLGKTVAADAMPDILAARDHRDGNTRWQAFLTLMQLDPAAVRDRLPMSLQPAMHAAAETFNRADFTSVGNWTNCLWQNSAAILVPATNNIAESDIFGVYRTPVDMDLLNQNDRIDQMLAALDRSESLGKDTIPFLLDVWQGTGKDEIATVITRVGDAGVPYLARVFDDQHAADLQIKVMGILQKFGPKARPAVPALVKAMGGSNEEVRGKAAETFASLGAAGKDAVPGLRKLLKADNTDVRRHAADALGLIGADAKPALPDLIALFPDKENQQLRVVAIRATSRIGKEAVEPLTKALDNPAEMARFAAVQALSWLQDDAKPALPALRKLAENDPSPQVREEALDLVRKLEAK